MLAPWGGQAAIMDLLAEAHASYQVRLLPAKRSLAPLPQVWQRAPTWHGICSAVQ